MPKKVYLATYGCHKNIVEAEHIAGLLQKHGVCLSTDINKARCAVVHTCSFIQSARDESAQIVRELSERKKNGMLSSLIVTGCMVQGEKEKLAQEFPLVDSFVGTGSLHNIPYVLQGEKKYSIGKPGGLIESCAPRLLSSNLPTAFIKISEGCDYTCSYCIIPRLRGPYKSRTMRSVLDETRELASLGIKELVVIAQNTTYYGKDRYGRYMLPELLEKMSSVNGIEWIKLLYAHPSSVTGGLIDVLKNNEKVCKYMALSVQHVSDRILRKMRRPPGIKKLLAKLKDQIPNFALRSELIVGFPGETEADFKELKAFVQEGWFDQLGVFAYSEHRGIPSSRLPEKVNESIKQRRLDALMRAQQAVVMKKNEERKGKIYKILVECKVSNSLYLSGRVYFQAPDVDNRVFFTGKAQMKEFAAVRITGYKGYDLLGETVR